MNLPREQWSWYHGVVNCTLTTGQVVLACGGDASGSALDELRDTELWVQPGNLGTDRLRVKKKLLVLKLVAFRSASTFNIISTVRDSHRTTLISSALSKNRNLQCRPHLTVKFVPSMVSLL